MKVGYTIAQPVSEYPLPPFYSDEGTDIGKYATYDSQLMDELKKKDRQCKETEEKMLEVESMLTEARVKALNLQQDVDSQNVQHQKSV